MPFATTGVRRRTRPLTVRRKQTVTRRVARQEVKKELNRKIETKFIDGYATGAITAISSAGSLFSTHGSYPSGIFVPMTQGTAENQYLGEKIEPRFLKVRWALDSGDSSNIVSIIVVQAKGAWTNIGDMSTIYQQTGTITAPLSAVNDHYNDRFRVLYRREVKMDSDDPTRIGSIKIGPKKLRRIVFEDNTGVDVEAGHLMIGFISDSTAVSHPVVRLFWRFYYKDA